MTIGYLVLFAVAWLLIAILVLRMHAFLALLTTACLVAVSTSASDIDSFATARVADGSFSVSEAESLRSASPVVRVTAAFGRTAGSIGIVIALASVIGTLLFHSGAAAVLVEAVLRRTGQGRAPEAIAAGSFLLGIPVFFDTVFYLMMPIARGLRVRTGNDYALYILAIFAGGAIAHSLIPPTPGPLQVAELLDVDVGTMLIAGLVIGGFTSAVSLFAARWLNSKVDLPLRDTEALNEHSDEPENGSTLGPPLVLAILPIALPVILLAAGSVVPTFGSYRGAVTISEVLGEKHVALGVGSLAAAALLPWINASQRRRVISASIASAGSIILITSAGGALGRMFYQAGIAEAVGSVADGFPGLMVLPLAWFVTAAIRTVQGSATIAMITSASILQGLALGGTLPFHPVYLAMAIGGGSKPISWMTDSGFWVISEMSGMTEREALRTISPMSLAMGLAALLATMIAATIVPGI
ncbi:MAG: gluconate permease [Planctomycetota bacterium]